MSLDLSLITTRRVAVYSVNITHNLADMAEEAGLYHWLWRPEPGTTAKDLVEPLRAGITAMHADPARFRAHDPPNGWGSYDAFLPWLESLLAACEENLDATVEADR